MYVFVCVYAVEDLEKNKGGGGGWIGMESTGLGSLNPKYHYEYQEIRGVASYLIHTPGSATGMYVAITCVEYRQEQDIIQQRIVTAYLKENCRSTGTSQWFKTTRQQLTKYNAV